MKFKFKLCNEDKYYSMDQEHINLYKEHLLNKYYDLMLSHHLLRYIDKLNGFQFEHFIAQICSLDLYEMGAFLTTQSHDFGIDVIYNNSYHGRKGMKYTSIGFQCKHTKGNSIPSQCLGETLEGINYYNLNYGIIITNGLFSSQTQKGYKHLNDPRLILMNRDKLLKFVKDVLMTANVEIESLKASQRQFLYKYTLDCSKFAKETKANNDVQGHDISTLINDSILQNKKPLKLC